MPDVALAWCVSLLAPSLSTLQGLGAPTVNGQRGHNINLSRDANVRCMRDAKSYNVYTVLTNIKMHLICTGTFTS